MSDDLVEEIASLINEVRCLTKQYHIVTVKLKEQDVLIRSQAKTIKQLQLKLNNNKNNQWKKLCMLKY